MLYDKKLAAHATEIVGEVIPDDVPDWTEGRPIRHFVLTLTRSKRERQEDKGLPSRALVFFKVEHTPRPWPTAKTPKDVVAYLERRLTARRTKPRVRRPASSINFDIKEQSWLLVELDDTINWRFSTNHPAATTKRAVPEGSNATLRYVVKRKDGRLELRTGVPAETCRFMFFRVVRRRKGETQGFNLAIELYQEVSGGKYLYEIPIIVDPDVPETGQEGFP